MKQSVPANFLTYIKYLLSKSPISTRELNRRIGKSSAYLSRLLGGEIKSIEYDTAYNIIKILVPDIQDIDNLLTKKFDIEPDEVILQQFNQARAEEERLAEMVENAQKLVAEMSDELINGVITEGDIERIEFLKDVMENFSPYPLSSDVVMIQAIIDIKNHNSNAYRLLQLFIGQLYETANLYWGTFINHTDKEQKTVNNMHNLLKEELNESDTTKDPEEVKEV